MPYGERRLATAGRFPLPSYFATPFERSGHCDFVRVFNVAAGRHACRDAGDADRVGLEEVGEERCCGFAFKRGAGGEDGFVDLAALGACGEGTGAQVFRADAVQRRQRAVQHVIDAVVVRAFDDGDAGRLFDDANLALIARRARAIDARIDIGDVVADGAEAQLCLELADGVGERIGIRGARAQNVKGEALRALGSDAGQLAQLLDEARHGLCES